MDNLWLATADTTGYNPVELPEILVSATRFRGTAGFSPSAISSLASTTLQALPARTLGEALSGLPGVNFRGYGGRQGVQTAAIRGTSTEQTLVLVDGVRATNPQTGITDLSLFSVSDIQRVDVVRGGQSALYGADAVGGVINVLTEIPTRRTTAKFQLAAGSSGYEAGRIALSGTTAGIGWKGSFLRERGRGDFRFRYDDGRSITTLHREGADFCFATGDLRFTYPFGDAVRGSTGVSFTDADRGAPGAVTAATQPAGARLADRTFRVHQKVMFEAPDSWQGNLDVVFSEHTQGYRDPLVVLNGQPLSSEHELNVLLVKPEFGREISPEFLILGGAEVGRTGVSSTNLVKAVRWQQSAYVGTQHSLSGTDCWPGETVFYPSLRYDHFPGSGGDICPKVGVSLSLATTPDVRFRASAGKSFRVPTFNELYWSPGGNPALSPERSFSMDVGVAASADLFGSWRADLSGFSIRTTNKITWMPGMGGIWSPRNSGRVSSRGIEAGVEWTDPSAMVHLSFVSTWTDARKLSEDYPGDPGRGNALPFTPAQVVHGTAAFSLAGLDFVVTHSVVSFRYVTEANDRILPGYPVTDASIRYGVSTGAVRPFLRLAGTNLFDTAYESFPQYPMPLREITLTIGGEL